MGRAIIDAVLSAGNFIKDHDILMALVIFAFVFITKLVIQGNKEEGKVKQPKAAAVEERDDHYRFNGKIIGGLLPFLIIAWVVFSKSCE